MKRERTICSTSFRKKCSKLTEETTYSAASLLFGTRWVAWRAELSKFSTPFPTKGWRTSVFLNSKSRLWVTSLWRNTSRTILKRRRFCKTIFWSTNTMTKSCSETLAPSPSMLFPKRLWPQPLSKSNSAQLVPTLTFQSGLKPTRFREPLLAQTSSRRKLLRTC